MVGQALRPTRSAAHPIAATYKTAAMIGLSALAICVAIGIGNPAQALAAVPPTAAATRPLHDNGPFYFWRGMELQPVAFRSQQSMLVERVEAGSPAARARLKPGDVLSSIDGMPVAHHAA